MIQLKDFDEQHNNDGSSTYTHDDYESLTLTIAPDHDCESPRENSNVGTMAISHDRYILGDCTIGGDEIMADCPACGGDGQDSERWMMTERRGYGWVMTGAGSFESMNGEFERKLKGREPWEASNEVTIERMLCTRCDGEGQIPCSPFEYFNHELGSRVVLPLYLYDHSGITIRVGSLNEAREWDTSFVGFIFDTPKGVEECIGKEATDEQIQECLEQEVKEYARYLEGDCWYWRVEDSFTGLHDALHGMIGREWVEESLQMEGLTDAIEKHDAEKIERAYWAQRGVATA